jgi:hypothetical protein
MNKLYIFLLCLLFSNNLFAGKVSGIVTDTEGNPLSYSSILVKGTSFGTTANNEGQYFLNLAPGKYNLVCQHIGYDREEKTIIISAEPVEMNFSLKLQQLSLGEVVVRQGAEDPAYEIIRQSIKKRSYYLTQVKAFECEVYIKGQLKLLDFPKKFMGQEVDFEDGDTSKKKMIFLSETVAKYSVKQPDKRKIEVTSTKLSGRSDGFGLSNPRMVSFYENNILLGNNLNPRGFVSPIADGALNFYRYKYIGTFYEDGIAINSIQVIPKRKYEPLFSGTINIVEEDWRIHSLNLILTKESQMQFVDSLIIEQLHVPVSRDVWMLKSQVVFPFVKFMGFDATGNFVSVYSMYNLDPKFPKGFFTSTILSYDTASNKKPADYWETVRPLPLLADEKEDYEKKDSLELLRKDPAYLDSLDRKRNKIKFGNILMSGKTFYRSKTKESLNFRSLTQIASYNLVEGLAANFNVAYRKAYTDRKTLNIATTVRYGFNNDHLNAHITGQYQYGKKYYSNILLSGGKRIYQFNNENPIAYMQNSIATLFYERNHLKIYETWFARMQYNHNLGEGLVFNSGIQFQDRLPINNTTDHKWLEWKNRDFTENYPVDLTQQNFSRHQAFILNAGISWRPKTRYIQYPDRKVSIGSKYPLFSLNYTKGINGILGSDIDYDKWRFSVSDNLNLKLAGSFRYRLQIGGFINDNKVEIQDYHHFRGNQYLMASPFLSSFQLLRFYKLSNTNSFYTETHVEHHFNGLLTNKIPGFKKLNWTLVAGINHIYLNDNRNYNEFFVGLEQVFKIMRVDFVFGNGTNTLPKADIRLTLRGMGRGNTDD